MTDEARGRRLERRGSSVVLPGFQNAHSHAFHRVLRGVGELASGDFWSWRRLMYEVADRLTPESYGELATYVYGEMVLAGYTSVGEFHYLHHQRGGIAYADPNEMSWALLEAARAAGIRLSLLDTCYLQASASGERLEGVQLRFSDGGGDEWSRRVTAAKESGRFSKKALLGAAIHSVRAVPRRAMESVVAWAAEEDAPLHVHVSEQPRENAECLDAYQMTPTDLLHQVGAITRRTTAVHATHLSATDVTRYGFARASICCCPTTEADLGDGVGPFFDLAESGAALCIGSDSHAVVDPFLEARSLETNQRLVTGRRGVLSCSELAEAAGPAGSRALGWGDEALSDEVEVRLDGSPSLAGAEPESDDAVLARVLYSATPADVENVTVDGTPVVEHGEHVRLGPPKAVAERLSRSIAALLR